MTDATSTDQLAVKALEGLLCRFNTDRLAYEAAERGLSVIKNLTALVTEKERYYRKYISPLATLARDAELALSNSQRLMRERREAEATIAQMRKAACELINEIDKHPIRTRISDTSINWFKRLLRETLSESTDEDEA